MDLLTRIISGIALAAIALGVLWAGSPWLHLLVLVVLAGAAGEWWRLCARGEGLAGVVALIWGPLIYAVSLWNGLAGLALLVLGGVLAMAVGDLLRGRPAWWSAGGVVYLGVPAAAVAVILASGGRNALLWLMLVIWAVDIGAYAAGRLIGGPKLAPRISPKKTWAGLIGGLVAAAIVGVAFSQAFGSVDTVIWPLVLAVVLGICGQLGDLFASWVKRRHDVKDFGRLIPGHGGVLDRIDGLLAGAPVFVAASWLLGAPL